MPEATDVNWDGSVATVTFREVDVALETEETTISVRVTADVYAVCDQGPSTVQIHRMGTSLQANDYPIGEDGVVEGTARVPLRVAGLQLPGYTCQVTWVSVVAYLEDFWTGATLVRRAGEVSI
ncbi:hypothetical protein [Mangrovihabitans endophyticus]|uniref:hypothetical protein n=1 Tax=Mangrovihabitans endophyticus TaxID=1751298 RepID=UPI00166DCD42|nr:hypothetical protein [Mangrovihabitans endophyticus]